MESATKSATKTRGRAPQSKPVRRVARAKSRPAEPSLAAPSPAQVARAEAAEVARQQAARRDRLMGECHLLKHKLPYWTAKTKEFFRPGFEAQIKTLPADAKRVRPHALRKWRNACLRVEQINARLASVKAELAELRKQGQGGAA